MFDGPSRSADAFQRGYLDPGTPGLRDFIPDRIVNAARLARSVAEHEAYYRAVRPPSQRASRDPAAFGEYFYTKPRAHPAWPLDKSGS